MQMSSNLVFDQLKSIRSTTTALMARVRKFKSELEDILMDDQDMCASSICMPFKFSTSLHVTV